MNNVSFQGNITITQWDRAVSSFKQYPTTKAQDKFIKKLANSFGEKGVIETLPKKKSAFIFKLLEKFIGKPVRNINNEKVFYNGGDNIVFSDRNPALFDGIRIEADLDL